MEGYIVITPAMIEDLGLKGTELLCFAVIHGFSKDRQGVFTGSISYVSMMLGMAPRTIVYALKSLVEKGLVEKTELGIAGAQRVEYQISKEAMQKLQGSYARIAQDLCKNCTPPSPLSPLSPSPTPPSSIPPISPKGEDERFENFWKLYPSRKGRKNGKAQARTVWLRLKATPELYELILAGLDAYNHSDEVQRGYAMDAARWLRGRRWEDEVETTRSLNQPAGVGALSADYAEDLPGGFWDD